MVRRTERQDEREIVAAYHKAQLGDLVQHVGEAVDRFRAGESDAFESDQALLQYSRAAKDLWKFCNLGGDEFVASLIRNGAPINWWERSAPRRR